MTRPVRLALTAVGYAIGAAVLLPVLRFVRQLLYLPPLFVTLGLGLLALGLPVALLIAWRYPNVGAGPDR